MKSFISYDIITNHKCSTLNNIQLKRDGFNHMENLKTETEYTIISILCIDNLILV